MLQILFGYIMDMKNRKYYITLASIGAEMASPGSGVMEASTFNTIRPFNSVSTRPI